MLRSPRMQFRSALVLKTQRSNLITHRNSSVFGYQRRYAMTLPQSVVKNMVKFQAKNSMPILMKGFKPDKAHQFESTSTGRGLGLASVANLVYQLNFAKKLK